MVGKVANNAGTVIKDKVSGTSMISEFNKEQEEFIKNKGRTLKNQPLIGPDHVHTSPGWKILKIVQ